MARRSDIDWEAIQKDYIASSLSLREIADKHGISFSTLKVKIKKEGWVRDLSELIKQRTKAKIATIDVRELVEQSAHESAHKSARLTAEAIEQESDNRVLILKGQRAKIDARFELADRGMDKLAEMLAGVADPRDMAAWSSAFKSNNDVMTKLIEKQRQNYGIDDEDQGNESIEDILQRI